VAQHLLLRVCWIVFLAAATGNVLGASNALEDEVRKRAAAIEAKLIAWRRDIHQHPELGDQETRTSGLVAQHLHSIGLEVRTGIARNGVIGILKGTTPGPIVALRADMDALPVTEPPGLPFASQAKGKMGDKEVDLMHACGHDAHTAMLMAAAEVLAGMRKQLPGTVMFIFQPAEEGSSIVTPESGKSWGAKLMLEEGVFKQTKPGAVFALHVMPGPLGELSYRSGPTAASSDTLDIRVRGKQGHGGMPWNTVDPIVTSALVISGLQTVVSRRANLTVSPAVVTIGMINGGTGANIVPEEVRMRGTIRTYNDAVRKQVNDDIRLTAVNIAESTGAMATVSVFPNYNVTVNNEALTKRMAPVLQRAADGKIAEAPLAGASEDFSFFAEQVPGLYVFLGVTPGDQDPAKAAPNHNPRFFVDESALVTGVRTLGFLAVNFVTGPAKAEPSRHAQPFVQENQ